MKRVLLFCFGVLWSATMASSAATHNASRSNAPDTGEITAITFEKSHILFRIVPRYKLTLHNDGTAHYVYRGVSEDGIAHSLPEKNYKAKPGRGEFARLAQLLQTQGFFGLQDRYVYPEHPLRTEGETEPVLVIRPVYNIRVLRRGQEKTVVIGGDSQQASPALRAVMAALQDARVGIKWQEVPSPRKPVLMYKSGVRGVALQGPVSAVEREGEANFRPFPGAIISVQRVDGANFVASRRADKDGKFQIPLPPGTYLIVPRPPDLKDTLPRAEPQTIVVRKDTYTQVKVDYDSGIR